MTDYYKQAEEAEVAYCWPWCRGIQFGRTLPEGALEICRAGTKAYEVLLVSAQWSYPDSAGVEHPMVPWMDLMAPGSGVVPPIEVIHKKFVEWIHS